MAHRDRQVLASQAAPSVQRPSTAPPEALNPSAPSPLVTLAIELEQKVAALSAERDAAGRRIAELEAAAMHTAAGGSAVADQNEVLKQGLAAAQVRIDELERHLEHGRFEMQQMARENGHLNTLVTDLQSKLDSVGQDRHGSSGQMPGEVAAKIEVLAQDLVSAQAHITELKQSLEESRDEVQQMEHENASLNALVAELQGNDPTTAAQTRYSSREFVNETAVNRITAGVFNRLKQWHFERFGDPAKSALWFDQHCNRLKLLIATVAAIIASGPGSDANSDQLLSRALAQIDLATRKECKAKLYALGDLVGWAEVHPAVLSKLTQVTARMFQDMRTPGNPNLSGW